MAIRTDLDPSDVPGMHGAYNFQEEWLDGSIWDLAPGEDFPFERPVVDVRNSLRHWASRKKVRIKTKIVSENGHIQIRAEV